MRQKIKNTDDKSLCNHYKKIIKKLKEHGKKLFSDPMTVYVDGEKRTIFILRTNNILEQHFRLMLLNIIYSTCPIIYIMLNRIIRRKGALRSL